MTYYIAGDDATVVYPITDANGNNLTFTEVVIATRTDGTDLEPPAAWLGAAGPQRDLEIELATLPVGLWHLRLVLAGADDLDLGEVVIVAP